MAMVNSVKDSRWLQLEVCREYQRNKCTRNDIDCKFAHPPAHVEVQNGRVIACYDSIKGRCNREKPPCKYFHPPQHLKDQLLINGRNHLAMKNVLLQQLPLQQQFPLQQHLQPLQLTPAVATGTHYMPPLAGHTAAPFSPYPIFQTGMIPADLAATQTQIASIVPAAIVPQKQTRTDRLEVCREYQRKNCKRAETECRYAHPPEHVTVDSAEGMVTVCMDFVKGRCTRDLCRYFHPTPHLQSQLRTAQSRANAAATQAAMAFTNYNKRPAYDKSGVPVFQPNNNPQAYQQAYQQAALALQVQQQPFVPVGSYYGHTTPSQTGVVRYIQFGSDWGSYCCPKILE